MASSANSGTLDLDTAPTTSTHALVEQLLALEPSQGAYSLEDMAGLEPSGVLYCLRPLINGGLGLSNQCIPHFRDALR